MRLTLKVIPRSSRNLVKKEKDLFKVYLTKPAQDGLANQQLIELLADYFKVKRYMVEIVAGANSRNKIVDIHE
jgi:uncharacterized protein